MMRHEGKGQSAVDLMILTGVVLLGIIPLLLTAMSRLDLQRETMISQSIEAIKDAANDVANYFESGASREVVVQIPGGVTGYTMDGDTLVVYMTKDNMTATFSKNVSGSFPVNEGRHYVNVYNNKSDVILYMCGNDVREAFEQCDGSDQVLCRIPAMKRCVDAKEKGSCRCRCGINAHCPDGTRCVLGACEGILY